MTNSTIQREYLTPPEAGELLGVGHDKILAWIHSGELRAIDLSMRRGTRPRWRIGRTALDAFLASRSTTPPPPKPQRRRRRDMEVTEYY